MFFVRSFAPAFTRPETAEVSQGGTNFVLLSVNSFYYFRYYNILDVNRKCCNAKYGYLRKTWFNYLIVLQSIASVHLLFYSPNINLFSYLIVLQSIASVHSLFYSPNINLNFRVSFS